MKNEEIDELLDHCPKLFHMAEKDSWASIKERGLLSTSALLDLYQVEGKERHHIEACHRPESVEICLDGLPSAVIRDQKPMSDKGLERCLQDGLSPSDWYRTLNSKVFFWMTEARLTRLLSARAYRNKEHDVLVLDSKSLIDAYRASIWFCPYNSGATKPNPVRRGKETFQRIDDYPYEFWRPRRGRGERVVELCVDYSVPDIEAHCIEVRRMNGAETVEIIESK